CLVGFARAIPDVCTFVTPIFQDRTDGYVIQEVKGNRISAFVPIFAGEEFVICPLRIAMRIGDLPLYGYEFAANSFAVATSPCLKPILREMMALRTHARGGYTDASISRFLALDDEIIQGATPSQLPTLVIEIRQSTTTVRSVTTWSANEDGTIKFW